MRFSTCVWGVLMKLLVYSNIVRGSRFSRIIKSSNGICKDDVHEQHEDAVSVIACAITCISDDVCSAYSYNSLTLKCRTHQWNPCVRGSRFRYYRNLDRSRMQKCPLHAGYTYNQTGICYKLHNSKISWLKAREKCREESGDLIKADTDLKLQVIRSVIYGVNNGSSISSSHYKRNRHCHYEEFYIGGHRKDNSGGIGLWLWVMDNTTIPNFTMNDPKSNCLELESECKGNKLEIDDTSCKDQRQRFFCEIVLQ